ncbi:MAG: TRAP transporter substrate-binding protein DctP [Elusimicrobia bacterium]|nr:TRAP transporter substrate-binding protein DctP [Elusimicrobiota bacterium]
MIISNLLLAAILSSARAEPKVIKFATLAPEGSTWMKVMNELNTELQEKTKGELKFKMYPGGISGDEKDVVKKVKIGQLHAAGFTGVGLGEIAPEVRILDAPWLFRSDKELDFVYKAFDKDLSAAIDKGGFVLLGWTELGPVYVFSKNPIADPDDMKKQKMWVWEGDPIAQAAYKAIGVSPIPLSVIDVMSSLQTGLIDAVYGPPMGVVALQWFTRAKHIYGTPMAMSTGAVLLSKSFFASLAPEQRKILLEVSRKHLKELNELSRKENDEALASLQKQGLTLSAKATPELLKTYQELGQKARRELVGKLYSASLLDRVEKSVADLRSGKPKKS